MRKVERYVTSDNVEHNTEKLALQHVERRVSDKVFKIADALYHASSRVKMVEYIMENLTEFQSLIHLQSDSILIDDDEE